MDSATQAEADQVRNEVPGNRPRSAVWLRRAWVVWLAGGALWLGGGLWLWRAGPSWQQGWVGWWAGDRMSARPLWNLQESLREGADTATVAGDRAYRLSVSSVRLGLWRDKSEAWSWAGWVLVEKKPEQQGAEVPLQLAWVQAGTEFDWQLWLRGGRWVASVDALSVGRQTEHRQRFDLSGPVSPPVVGRWVHLAYTSGRGLHKLYVDGSLVEQQVTDTLVSPQLAALEITAHVPYEFRTSLTVKPVVLHDGVATWDRSLSAEEVAALASAGRGAWGWEADRQAFAGRWMTWGRWGGLAALVLLLGWSGLRWFMGRARLFADALPRPSFRPVIVVLAMGLTLTGVATGLVKAYGRRADKARFAELVSRIRSDTDDYWETQAGLGMRARDWLAAQAQPDPKAWAAWLHANHFPHDYAGVIGIGYAEQVMPADLAEHEARWWARYGFPYRVHPERDPAEARPIQELTGNPRLPVVMYAPAELAADRWLTNGSILGRDLLHVPKSDRRQWSESIRVEQAVSRNEVTASDLEEIAPEGWYGRRIEGLRLYVPWTLRDKASDWDLLEPEAWRGVWFVSVDFRAVVGKVLSEGEPLVGYRIYTGTMGGQRHALVLDTGTLNPATADRPGAYLRSTLEIPLYYSRLYLEVWTTPAFEAQSTRWRPWWIGGAGLGITFLVAALLFVQVRAREAQQSVLDALREANTRLLTAYREREHLSRDLHDGSIQNLYALGLHLQRVEQLLATTPTRARAELRESLGMLDHSIAELRQFILSAGVDSLAEQTTTTALEGLVSRMRRATDMGVRLDVHAAADRLSATVGVHVLQIVREALSNALRHSGAREVRITLAPAPEPDESPDKHRAAPGTSRWRLAVCDDGRGFDTGQVNDLGQGLRNVAARAKELGGGCRVSSAPGQGTELTVEFPE